MNWIGGARARAKAQEQLNRSRRNFPDRPRTQNQQTDGDRDDGGTDSDNENNVEAEDDPGPVQALRQSRKRRREEDNPANDWKKEVDYVSLGYKLVKKTTVHRRVVPLLEFAEKTFPKYGHILSLQLSHQMDIQRTPEPQPIPNFDDDDTRNCSVPSSST